MSTDLRQWSLFVVGLCVVILCGSAVVIYYDNDRERVMVGNGHPTLDVFLVRCSRELLEQPEKLKEYEYRSSLRERLREVVLTRDIVRQVPAVRLAQELCLIDAAFIHIVMQNGNDYLKMQALPSVRTSYPSRVAEIIRTVESARSETAKVYYDWINVRMQDEIFCLEKQAILNRSAPELTAHGLSESVASVWGGSIFWRLQKGLEDILDREHSIEWIDAHPSESRVTFRLLAGEGSRKAITLLSRAKIRGVDYADSWSRAMVGCAVKAKVTRQEFLKLVGEDPNSQSDLDYQDQQRVFDETGVPKWLLENPADLLY